MGKVIRVKVSEPKTKQYAEFTECIVQNLRFSGFMGKPATLELRFIFNDEFNGFSILNVDANCSKKNVIKHLSPYFNKIEFR